MSIQKLVLGLCVFQVLLLLLLSAILFNKAGVVNAQDPQPFPKPYYDCADVYDPLLGKGEDFHSLRPFQASPCLLNKQDTALFCSNKLLLFDDFSVNKAQAESCINTGSIDICHFKTHRSLDNILIEMTGAEFPILGNTEDVTNSQNITDTDALLDAEKVNEYVSWYLNGVNYRPEYPHLALKEEGATDAEGDDLIYYEGEKKLVDFSGPLKKLLPWDIQSDLRSNTINRAVAAKASGNTDQERHNQIVGCTYGLKVYVPLLGIKEIGGFPARCYEPGFIKGLINDVFTQRHRLIEWAPKDNRPPKRSDFPDFLSYYIEYRKWRGDACIPFKVPGVNLKFVLCGENPLAPDYISNLYPYIPFSTTEDRMGSANIKSSDVQEADASMNIYDVTVDSVPATLFFPHTQEADELGEILQSTYTSKDLDKTAASNSGVNAYYCDIANVRTNEGDNLFPTYSDEFPDGKFPGGMKIKRLEYTAEFDCAFPTGLPGSCSKTAQVMLDTETETPLADSIWSRFVEGPQSIFKRIFPKVGDNTPVEKILDLPGSTDVTYKSSPDMGLQVVRPGGAKGSNPELYFPHIGSVYEYFLKGIQTALRPKGMGAPITGGNIPQPGQPPAPGQCSTGFGPCDVGELLTYFGNNITYATYASQVCQIESGSSPTIINDGCLRSETPDYSIGLFQINLLAHCPDAFTPETVADPWNMPCKIADQNKLNECIAFYSDPIKNIQKAVSLSGGGSKWSGAWVNAAAKCGLP
jgi:hypothetical protein